LTERAIKRRSLRTARRHGQFPGNHSWIYDDFNSRRQKFVRAAVNAHNELFSPASVCSCKYAPADGNLPMINRPHGGLIQRARPFQENNRTTSLLLSDRPLDENVIYRCQMITSRVSTGAVWRNDDLDSAFNLIVIVKRKYHVAS